MSLAAYTRNCFAGYRRYEVVTYRSLWGTTCVEVHGPNIHGERRQFRVDGKSDVADLISSLRLPEPQTRATATATATGSGTFSQADVDAAVAAALAQRDTKDAEKQAIREADAPLSTFLQAVNTAHAATLPLLQRLAPDFVGNAAGTVCDPRDRAQLRQVTDNGIATGFRNDVQVLAELQVIVRGNLVAFGAGGATLVEIQAFTDA